MASDSVKNSDSGVVGRAADNIRLLTVAMVERAKSGHPAHKV